MAGFRQLRDPHHAGAANAFLARFEPEHVALVMIALKNIPPADPHARFGGNPKNAV
jgi:hypothetical protein